jgi:hypothetical protein
MTTNIHDKMLAAIDAYFSASDGTEAEVAENLLLDVRDEINKQQSKAQPAPVKTYHDFEPLPVAPVPNGPYSAPIKELWPVAPKPWAGLTDEEIDEHLSEDAQGDCEMHEYARSIEAKLREKNGGAA